MPDIGFPYSADPDAEILILGSMPSRISLAEKQYYAHPRNAFWPIMAKLFEFSNDLPYRQRLAELRHHHIALWDSAHRCTRAGSLDSAIRSDSVVCNDFNRFLVQHKQIRRICFNGCKAAELYRRYAYPALIDEQQQIETLTLPSTSPAHASMTFGTKLELWRQAIAFDENARNES